MKALLALALVALAPAAPAAPAPPARVRVTFGVIQVPQSVRVEPGPRPAADVYRDLLMDSAGEATEISLVTPADFPGEARYNHAVVFTLAALGQGGAETHAKAENHGKADKGVLNETTFLEATPHVNPDGTITVRFQVQVTQNVPRGPLSARPRETVTSRSVAATRTFQDGKAQVLGGLLETTQTREAGKQVLTFVTVSVLPPQGEKSQGRKSQGKKRKADV